MINSPNSGPSRNFDLAAFLAVPVTAIILISVLDVDPVIVRATVDLVFLYFVRWTVGCRPAGRGPSRGAGPTPSAMPFYAKQTNGRFRCRVSSIGK